MDQQKLEQLERAARLGALLRVSITPRDNSTPTMYDYRAITKEQMAAGIKGGVLAIDGKAPHRQVSEPLLDPVGIELNEVLLGYAVCRALDRFVAGDFRGGSFYERTVQPLKIDMGAIERGLQRARALRVEIEVRLFSVESEGVERMDRFEYPDVTPKKLAESKAGHVEIDGHAPTRSVKLRIPGQPTSASVDETVDRALRQFERGEYTGGADWVGAVT